MTLPDVLWRTNPAVNVDGTPDHFGLAKTWSGACIRSSDTAGLTLDSWKGGDQCTVTLSYDDAALLHQAMTTVMNTVACNYLARATAAQAARPDLTAVTDAYEVALAAYAEEHLTAEPTTTKAPYRAARAAFWDALQVGDDEPLPAWTDRICCQSKFHGSTHLTLTHDGGDRWSYRRGNGDSYFSGTLDELRADLKDPSYKP